ncbi:GntR family transcriptional regulator [Fuscibacter oryzae]|uniref:GntR family transcriptional regulator n=1 Tax=Fuscibacter oryzae TaxID=2803939 RepID=A0A8J7MZ02_9RHOB|nr:GntR family transcriptional regulator [Fuscibacter oryzae]MBL4929549.1 GntR family transcriptional regulator [Fuscibacter oryzae]
MAIVDDIRRDLLTGRLPPGSLLSQTDLATAHGVSRIPVRDALQALAAEKLVTIVPGKGARVLSLTPEELAELYDLRILLEGDLIARATSLADAAAHAEAEYACRKSSLEAGRPGWAEGDWLFHRTLYQPANRPRQLAIVQELRQGCVLFASGYHGLADQTPRWLTDHAAILGAYVTGQAEEAAVLLRKHLAGARDHLLAARRETAER